MRSNSRIDVLSAAMQVLEAGDDVTYSSVAERAGLTKAGLMYHFASKELMMIAIIEHVLSRWQEELEAELHVRFQESTLQQRVEAFVRFISAGGTTPGDFTVFADSIRHPELAAPWLAYLRRWFGFGTGMDNATLLLVWLAANGLWIAEATGIVPLTSEQRTLLTTRLLSLLEGTPE